MVSRCVNPVEGPEVGLQVPAATPMGNELATQRGWGTLDYC